MSFDVNEIMSISLQYNNVCLVREGSEDLVTVGNDNRTDFIWFTFPANPHKYLHRSYITRNYEYLASYSCPLIKFKLLRLSDIE